MVVRLLLSLGSIPKGHVVYVDEQATFAVALARRGSHWHALKHGHPTMKEAAVSDNNEDSLVKEAGASR